MDNIMVERLWRTVKYVDEITLGNASNADIKAFIRKQDRMIQKLEAKLEMILLRKKERALNRKRSDLQGFIKRNDFL